MHRLTAIHALLFTIMLQMTASGGMIQISGSGTWSATTPTTTLTAANATWSFTFEVPDPLSGAINPYGNYISTALNAVYELNGLVVNDAITSITYYSGGGPDGGLFDINFASGVLNLFGDQIYNANLYLIPGEYVASIKDNLGSGSGSVIVGVGVPEPSSIVIGGMGLILVAIPASRHRHLSHNARAAEANAVFRSRT